MQTETQMDEKKTRRSLRNETKLAWMLMIQDEEQEQEGRKFGDLKEIQKRR